MHRAHTNDPFATNETGVPAMEGPPQPTQPEGMPGQPQAADVVLKLHDSIELLDRCIGMQHIAVLNDKRIGKFYHLGGNEAAILSLINGQRSIGTICRSMSEEDCCWTDEEIQGWALMLIKSGLAVAVDVDEQPMPVPGNPPSSSPSSSGEGGGPGKPSLLQSLQKKLGPLGYVISQRIPIASADRVAVWFLPTVGRLFSPQAALTAVACGVAALTAAWSNRQTLGDELRMMFSPAALPLLAVIWVLLKAIHEVGHAVAAKRNGVRVGKFGVTFFLFAPIPFVDVTDAWRVRRVWSRVQIAMAGVYLEGWTAIVATVAFVLLPEGLGKHLAAQWMMMAGPATWLVNANPLLRMDGYYALADAMNVPNLRMHGRAFWASLLDRALLGVPLRPLYLHGWRLWATVIHAAASLIFQATWMSGLVIAVLNWGGPLGFFIACTACILWAVLPVFAWFYRHWTGSSEPEAIDSRPRLVAVGLLGCVLIMIGLNISSPFRRSVPVVVQYRDEQVVRAASPGFVAQVNVVSGQWVNQGDLMLVIRDDDLVLRRDQMRDELEVAMSKQRQLVTRGDLGAAEAQTETIRSLKESLAELNQSIGQLSVTAARRGIVVSPHPGRNLGRHVKQGDVLLRVADPDDKELLVVFPETEWAGYSRVFDKSDHLQVRLRGGTVVTVKPLPARPRFSDRLPNASFAGSGGGDIPVVPDASAEDGFRAAFPVGEAVAKLSPVDSKRLLSGQRGRMYLSDTRTIAQRIWMQLNNE
jgi:putative peptide zinc metalloprotease protein